MILVIIQGPIVLMPVDLSFQSGYAATVAATDDL